MLQPPGFYYVKKPKRFVILSSDKSSERNLSCFFDIIKPMRLEHLQSEEPISSDPYFSRYIISVGILNSHKFRDSSWLLNWYVSLSLYKQALGRNQWILLCRSPNGATRRTPRLMELLTHDWTTTTTWREPFSIHTFIEHGILFNNAGISFPFHPTHSSWIWHNELFNSFCISTGCYWKIVVRITWNW